MAAQVKALLVPWVAEMAGLVADKGPLVEPGT